MTLLPGKPPVSKEALRRIMELWIDTESKVRVLVFFRENPGIIETAEGLARRLGSTRALVDSQLRDYAELGVLRTVHVDDRVVYVFDKARTRDLEEMVHETARAAGRSA